MDDLLKLFMATTPTVAVAVVLGYLLKVYLEKRIESAAGRLDRRLDQIASTSLEIKKDMRGEERNELLKAREAIENWEDFLQNVVGEVTMLDAQAIDISGLVTSDRSLFLAVKIGIVRTCVYLRDRELEQRLMSAVIKVRQTYYPLINLALGQLIEVNTQLMPLQMKLAAFQQSNYTAAAHAPTEADRQQHAACEAQQTEVLKQFSEALLRVYPDIAETLFVVKEGINDYIYRPIERAELDRN